MAYYADYYQHLPGAKTGARSIDPLPYHAGVLGRDFHSMQAPHIQTRVLGMIGYSNSEGAILLSKSPGWFKLLLTLAFRYFLDLPWRSEERRVGKECVGRCRSRGSRYHEKNKY